MPQWCIIEVFHDVYFKMSNFFLGCIAPLKDFPLKKFASRSDLLTDYHNESKYNFCCSHASQKVQKLNCPACSLDVLPKDMNIVTQKYSKCDKGCPVPLSS